MAIKTKCMVIDDEPLGIELIQNHLSHIETMQVVASCNSAMKAYDVLKHQKIDLLFLDIQMPLITGLDFLKSLKNPPKVIITTAFRNYAVEGYELDVIDYLLKPITFNRFLKAIEKYYQHVARDSHEVIKDSKESDFIYLRSNKKNYKIYTTDILYIESIKDYIQVHSRDDKLIVKQTMSEVEALLAGKSFLRIHRSYLINVEKITAFTVTDIQINKTELPIGSSYKQFVSSALNSANS
jgi:two-component system LytT family response regulator